MSITTLAILAIILIAIGIIALLVVMNNNRPEAYDPNEGYFSAKLRTKAAQVHYGHIQAQTDLLNAQRHLNNLPNQWVQDDLLAQVKEEQLRLQIINTLNEQKLSTLALQHNLTTYQLQEVAKELLLKKGVLELEAMANKINQQDAWVKFQQQIEAIILTKTLPGLKEVGEIQKRIDVLVKEIHEIEAAKELGWEEMVEDRRKTVRSLRKQKKERE